MKEPNVSGVPPAYHDPSDGQADQYDIVLADIDGECEKRIDALKRLYSLIPGTFEQGPRQREVVNSMLDVMLPLGRYIVEDIRNNSLAGDSGTNGVDGPKEVGNQLIVSTGMLLFRAKELATKIFGSEIVMKITVDIGMDPYNEINFSTQTLNESVNKKGSEHAPDRNVGEDLQEDFQQVISIISLCLKDIAAKRVSQEVDQLLISYGILEQEDGLNLPSAAGLNSSRKFEVAERIFKLGWRFVVGSDPEKAIVLDGIEGVWADRIETLKKLYSHIPGTPEQTEVVNAMLNVMLPLGRYIVEDKRNNSPGNSTPDNGVDGPKEVGIQLMHSTRILFVFAAQNLGSEKVIALAGDIGIDPYHDIKVSRQTLAESVNRKDPDGEFLYPQQPKQDLKKGNYLEEATDRIRGCLKDVAAKRVSQEADQLLIACGILEQDDALNSSAADRACSPEFTEAKNDFQSGWNSVIKSQIVRLVSSAIASSQSYKSGFRISFGRSPSPLPNWTHFLTYIKNFVSDDASSRCLNYDDLSSLLTIATTIKQTKNVTPANRHDFIEIRKNTVPAHTSGAAPNQYCNFLFNNQVSGNGAGAEATARGAQPPTQRHR